MDTLYDRIKEIGSQVKTSTDRRIVKMGEEYGEFCEAYLRSVGFKDKGKRSEKKLRKDILQEGCDVLIMTMDILADKGFSRKDIIEMSHKKLDKWQAQEKRKGRK